MIFFLPSLGRMEEEDIVVGEMSKGPGFGVYMCIYIFVCVCVCSTKSTAQVNRNYVSHQEFFWPFFSLLWITMQYSSHAPGFPGEYNLPTELAYFRCLECSPSGIDHSLKCAEQLHMA